MASKERMLYHTNKLSYNLCLIYISLTTFHAILILRKMTTNYTVGILFLTTVTVLMLGFLTAVKVMAYSIKYGYVAIALGVYQIIQMFTIPDVFQGNAKLFLILILIISTVAVIASGIISIVKTKQRIQYIKLIENKVAKEK